MLERYSASTSFIDVLDRVLDKGVVIDAWIAFSLAGINLMTIDARVVVASVETYLRDADKVARALAPGSPQPALPADTVRHDGRQRRRRRV